MPVSFLGVVRGRAVSPRELAARSRSALDRPLRGDAELWVTEGTTSDARVVGAFQRVTSAPDVETVRRISGGPAVRVGEGSVHVCLALASPSALVACDAARLLNRYVRPLLAALTKIGARAHYFGRDWVSVAHRPAAWIGCAHDSGTGRAVVEAIIAVGSPLADRALPSFLGREPGTLESITGRPFDNTARVADAVVDAYAKAYGRAVHELDGPELAIEEEVVVDPPWSAVVDAPMGIVGAGRDHAGTFRVGGELFASRDAIARLEERVGALPPDAGETAVAAIVEDTLGAAGVALDGVRSLRDLADVIARARLSYR